MDELLNNPVTLVIKAPNQKIADQRVECALSWTVRKLKKHLADVYPNQPLEKEQRIIYSGRLLQDDATLKDVLRQNYKPCAPTGVQVGPRAPMVAPVMPDGVRLRCTTASINLSAAAGPVATSAPAQPTVSGSTATSVSYPLGAIYHPPYSPHQENGMAHYPNLTMPYGSVPYGSMPYVPHGSMPYGSAWPHVSAWPHGSVWPHGTSLPSQPGMMMPDMAGGTVGNAEMAWRVYFEGSGGMGGYGVEQRVWMQQAYAHYFNQYLHFYQSNAQHTGQFFDPQFQMATPQTYQDTPAQPLADAAPADRPAARLNAQGGPMGDENDNERDGDWLDWVYTAIRFMMLLCILLIYSTMLRFVTTLVLVIIVYLYQMGWFNDGDRRGARQRRVAGRPPQPPILTPPGEQPPQPNHEEEDEEEEEEEEIEEGSDDPSAVEETPAQPGTLKIAWNFVVAFFVSLAPELPPAVNAN